MKKTLQGIVIASVLASGLTCGSVLADENEFEVSANVGIFSQYIWRGWSLNDNPSLQGGFDVAYGNFTAGIWGGEDRTLGTEIDFYVGWGKSFHDYFAVDVGFVQYRFDKESVELDEVHLTLDFTVVSVTYHDGEADYDYLEINKGFELGEQFSLDLHYGQEGNHYNDWYDYGVTLSYAFNDSYTASVGYSDKENNDEELYFSLVGTFE
ncbi:MAG: hypothetical protein ACI8WB_003399 [Phenylobacterium sp.]|jgi:uncharacterized protein (TIGR02001 family)